MKNDYITWLKTQIEYYKERVESGRYNGQSILTVFKSKLSAYSDALEMYKTMAENGDNNE